MRSDHLTKHSRIHSQFGQESKEGKPEPPGGILQQPAVLFKFVHENS